MVGPFVRAVAGVTWVRQSAEREPVGAGRYAALVVLGDSLSDNGNAGRALDCPVWVQRLWKRSPPAPAGEPGAARTTPSAV